VHRTKPRIPVELSDTFNLEPVRCFIAPAEREKIVALTSKDSMSLRSQRTDPGGVLFETIEEDHSGRSTPSSGRSAVEANPKKRPPTKAMKVPKREKSTEAATVAAKPSPSGRMVHMPRKNFEVKPTDEYVLLCSPSTAAAASSVVSPPAKPRQPRSAAFAHSYGGSLSCRKQIHDEYAIIEAPCSSLRESTGSTLENSRKFSAPNMSPRVSREREMRKHSAMETTPTSLASGHHGASPLAVFSATQLSGPTSSASLRASMPTEVDYAQMG
jgi:hypothetical protein